MQKLPEGNEEKNWSNTVEDKHALKSSVLLHGLQEREADAMIIWGYKLQLF